MIMLTSTKTYTEFWQKKLDTYVLNLDKTGSDIYKKLDNQLYNWNLNLDLSDEISISMRCDQIDNQIY